MQNLNHNQYYTAEYYENRQILPESLVEAIGLFLKEHSVSSVLEIGCGSGFLLRALRSKGYSAYGCDISFHACRQAGQINASAIQLPFKNASVDAVIAISMIEHLSLTDARFFLMESLRVLKNKGVIFLVTPNKRSLKTIIFGTKGLYQADPSHINFFTPNSLSLELKKIGFNNTRACFNFPQNCSLVGWFLPAIIQNVKLRFLRDLVNWALISSPLGLIRDSFWISGEKQDQSIS